MDLEPVAGRPAGLRATLGVAVVVVVATLSLAVVGLLRSDGRDPRATPTPTAAPPVPPVSVTDAVSSLAVLRAWDRARSAAWSTGDVRALRELYHRGSEAGRRDVGMLRRWSDRGLRVRRMAMQVLAVELRARTAHRIALDVTDRLAGAVAVPVGGGARRSLPEDRVSTRRLVFGRTAGGWVLVRVYDRPLASTAVTSGSSGS